jgi:Na+-transporting methylmalonyl-CoA/oxaloacetate decarboxylase gamma subunit
MNPYLIAGLGYLIVFLVLLLLYLVFSQLPRVLGSVTRVQAKALEMMEAAQGKAESSPESVRKDGILTGEVNAAIATALHLYLNEQHDEEDPRLTIEQLSRKYSPWSSKIYGVMNQPDRR